MPEKWTGRLVGRMHNERVTMQQIANEMGVTKSYVSMILNSKKKPAGAQERLEAAFAAVVADREVTANAAEN